MAGENSGRENRPNGSPASSDQGGNLNSSQFNGNPPSTPLTPDSPTSAGFNTDQLPFNTSRTSENYSDYDDDEAAVDPEIIRDEPEEGDEDEGEGEDLFNDNYIEDYRRMDENDQYESAGLFYSLEGERDLDQIMADRMAAEIELDQRYGRSGEL